MTNRFSTRDLLIIDEAHQTEPQLLDFISISISDDRLQHFGFELRKFKTPEEYWLFFEQEGLVEKIGRIIKEAIETEDIRTQDDYNSLLRKVLLFTRYMAENDEWVAEYIEHKRHRVVRLKPVFVKSKSHEHLLDYGGCVLFMSATILSTSVFCSALDVSKSKVASYRMINRFPVKNRQIFYRPAAKIVGGKKKMPNWAPKLTKVVDEIVEENSGKRGIIHTHNFAIAEWLMTESTFKHRFLFQRQFRTKDDMLNRHRKSVDSVLVAPAMHEGLDLVDDLSRFQIICKIPWPNLYEDLQLARRVELERDYYLWLTALKLVQSSGRSVRSANDWAKTYVLDEVFVRFLDDARRMIPSWFHEAVVF